MHYYLYKIDASHSITKKVFLVHTGEPHSTRLDHIRAMFMLFICLWSSWRARRQGQLSDAPSFLSCCWQLYEIPPSTLPTQPWFLLICCTREMTFNHEHTGIQISQVTSCNQDKVLHFDMPATIISSLPGFPD